jgi:hypothetical protein
MLLNVITDVAAETGMDLDSQKEKLIRLANRAAKEMWKELECNKIYREVTLVVPIDKVVSLPSIIGELRGMRMHTNELPFDLHSIGQPRYITTTMGYKFKNWRDLGESAVHTVLSGAFQIILNANGVEDSPVEVIIDGQTNNAQQDQEIITVDNNFKQSVKIFGPQIDSISCFSNNRINDITIKLTDDNGTEIATLYNNQQKTRYKIVDVSQVYWSIDTSLNESFIDVMYKVPQTKLIRDGDSFYAGDDFDEAWFSMCMFFYLKPLQNRMQDALAAKAMCMDFLRSAKDSTEQGIVKKIQFGRNKFYGLFSRYRSYPGSITNVDNNVQ